MKKVSFFVTLLLVLAFTAVRLVYASDTEITDGENIDDNQLELQQCLTELQQDISEIKCITTDNEDIINSYFEEYSQKLNDMGYENYVINEETYDELYDYLNMNFEEMGIDRNGKYLVVFSNGEPTQNSVSRESNGPVYKYTYNGTEYTMRRCTVTAADSPHYAVAADAVNIYSSGSKEFFINFINVSLCSYLDYMFEPLHFGTILSILGLDVSRISSTTKNATLYLLCAANWTRVFTQVYSTYDGMWLNCSSAEYVQQRQSLSGQYYDSVANMMKDVSGESEKRIRTSLHYGDNEWLNRQAAISFFNGSGCNYDHTGAVSFSYEHRDANGNPISKIVTKIINEPY